MEKVIRFKCEYCGNLLYTREECADEEQRHRDINTANEMLNEGKTLGEINKKLHIWYKIPEYVENVNKDNCFVIPSWQCCNEPIYQIFSIKYNGSLYVYGRGRYESSYGEDVYICSNYLKNPRPKEELYIYKDLKR